MSESGSLESESESESDHSESEPVTSESKPGSSEGTSGNPEDVIIESIGPDENALVWVARFDEFAKANDQLEKAVKEVNKKLEQDGKSYRLKVIGVAETDVETLQRCGADIVKIDGYHNNGQKALNAGLMAPLDEWLPGSKLQQSMTEILWEMGQYRGSHYFIPDESFVPVSRELWVNPTVFPKGLPEEFDGNIYSLEKYISPEHPLCFYEFQLDMVDGIGYVFDYMTGMVYKGDQCVNPLEEPEIRKLLQTLNRWYREGKLVYQPADENSKIFQKCALAYGRGLRTPDVKGWKKVYTQEFYACHQVTLSTGILASSEKKAEAFDFLELVFADRSYAKILGQYNARSFVFGLDIGLPNNRLPYQTLKARNRYYEENFVPSPSLYLDYPDEWQKLWDIEYEYTTNDKNVITAENFDAAMKEFEDKLNGPMEKAIREVNASRK